MTFEVIGVKALVREFSKARRNVGRRMARAARDTANAARRRMRRTLAEKRYSRGTAKSIRYRMEGTTAVLTVGFPGHIIEHGTRPFFPPPRVLEAWAGSKLGDPRAAYPVARAISERGLAPFPFFQPAIDAERARHASRVSKALFGMELFRG